MDMSSDIFPRERVPEWVGPTVHPMVWGTQPRAPANRNATSRSVTKAEQRVALGVAA